MILRKIVWRRPTVHVVRRANGSWNLADILPRPDPAQPVPIIQFEHATVFFDDQQCRTGLVPLEIKDVNLTIINDPLPALHCSGTGFSELLGKIVLEHCTFGRKSKELTAAVKLPDMTVDRGLLRRLTPYFPDLAAHPFRFSGHASLEADLSYQSASGRPWSHDVRCQLRQGRLQSAQCPLVLDNLVAKLRWIDDLLMLESLQAQAGGARVALNGEMLGAQAEADLKGSLRVEHLEVTPELLARLPDKLQHIEPDYHPRGLVNVAIDHSEHGGQTMLKQLTHTQVWVHDQDEALAFYTEKLGMELREDVTVPEMGNFRWLSVGVPGQDDVAITLMAVPGPPVFDEDTREKIQSLLAKGASGGLFFSTDDVQGTYEELKSRGVEFSQEPTEQPYGIDAGFRDLSGNQFRVAQQS